MKCPPCFARSPHWQFVGFIIWIVGSLFNPFLPFEFPAFHWAEQGLDAAALLISTGVLVEQNREENFAEQRTQLMLQLNLLSEQKIAKTFAYLVPALLSGGKVIISTGTKTLQDQLFNRDLPNVRDRYDPEAIVMQEAADPIAVLNALQETLQRELATNEIDKCSTEADSAS